MVMRFFPLKSLMKHDMAQIRSKIYGERKCWNLISQVLLTLRRIQGVL